MLADTAIEVRNVTKRFRIHVERNATLKERILYAGRGKHRDFVALQDVSIDIYRGSTVGLLGVNGSGKSTLLKLMSRILYPDAGQVVVRGRVSSLLELGAGFHPDFTGRENVYMNGALLGLSKKEIGERLDEIIDFSELGEFVDQPVRSYSSGMYMRLAFSVAVAVDPEILLIDEILAVGDAAFQAKCMNRIRKLQGQGKTIVIVTHDTAAVERFCDSVVWMHNSRVRMSGEPVPCVQAYLDAVFRDSHNGKAVMSLDRVNLELSDGGLAPSDEPNGEADVKQSDQSDAPQEKRFGNGLVRFSRVSIRRRGPYVNVRCGEGFDILLEFVATEALDDVVFGFALFSSDGFQCYGTNTFIDRIGTLTVPEGTGSMTISVEHLDLLQGDYSIDVAVHSSSGEPYDYWRSAQVVKVTSDRAELGIVRLQHAWTLNAQE